MRNLKMLVRLTRRAVLPLAALLLFPAASVVGADYDLVLEGGRVMDPETGLDAVRNVGIRGDSIVEISESPLAGSLWWSWFPGGV